MNKYTEGAERTFFLVETARFSVHIWGINTTEIDGSVYLSSLRQRIINLGGVVMGFSIVSAMLLVAVVMYFSFDLLKEKRDTPWD